MARFLLSAGLLYPFFTSVQLGVRATTAGIANHPNFLGEIAAFQDYEVLSVHQEGDEDVSHLQKRAGHDESCEETDCVMYTGWEEDRKFTCTSSQNEEEEGGDNLNERSLVNRGSRKYKTHPDSVSKRCYDAEHVLEWNMLAEFLQEEGYKDDAKSRCHSILEFFEGKMEREDIKVKVAKVYNKALAKGDHFDYEEKTFVSSKIKDDPRPIDWITHQWPGTKKGNTPNPWEYELVLLMKDVNIKKENMSQKNQANNDTLEWLFVSKTFNRKDGQTKWPKNEGKCAAIYCFNTVIGIAQYHNNPYIQEIMRAQVNQVGDAFEYRETKVLPGRMRAVPV
ncbi:uncharacterized protein EI97DRAFT_490465 [Westerdykella ornata]|uniref:Uncharacterized protein n=1 Tax=Westerdykella ornata TaxID=318751 RepID=A0A6A6JJV5_WESOR|nr:uncharacterized protein EI97DRAFT_490465 [Westerdykella ornata]KAF2276881.1 hypothetical protein EI97DRAFT_490465 [Westerdykella ornata]